ncbi:MAG: ATP-dependent Clp protease ATP-binding subunit [Deltaproteobacteria bacterium]|nr:ATP-dependent Clp protease ATP-binding subunit [Deltaproteobacteria bacterium]
MTRSDALSKVLAEAADIAGATDQPMTSGHVLLAMFTTRNSAESFLLERGIDEDRLLVHASGDLSESAELMPLVLKKAESLAASCGSPHADCLHLLVAVIESPRSAARRLLVDAGTPIDVIKSGALRVLTRVMPRWMVELASTPGAHEPTERPQRSESPWDYSPSLRTERPSTYGHDELTVRPGVSHATLVPTPAERVSLLEPEALLVPTADIDDLEDDLEPLDDDDPAGRYRLSPSRYPWLTSLARNLSVEALEGRIESIVGRDREIEALIDILGKRFSNNPCLIGEPGVGKTAIVECLAEKLTRLGGSLGDRIVLELDVGSLLVGTHFRGAFSEKLKGIKEEVERSEGRIVIFFDELHTLVGAGASGDGALDAANELKTALARGAFPCIGATTPAEWKKHIESDPALKRRFYPVQVSEPSPSEAEQMIRFVLPAFAKHHGVHYEDGAVSAAVKMSSRFIPEGQLPDKALALIDFAGSRAARSGSQQVSTADIAAIVSERAKVPKDRILASDKERLLKLESLLAEHIVGHDDALKRIAEVMRRNAAGFSAKRPQASFLLLGPSGVGKTETAKALASILFGSLDALLHFDLSEYSEGHSIARLVGAPPGYVGHDAGGQLSDAVRKRPSCVLLLDEIEKAHRDVLQIFLQVLDEGRVTDSKGQSVSFCETIIVMTSNLGAELFDASRSIGFGERPGRSETAELPAKAEKAERLEAQERAVLERAKRSMPPELYGRVEERLVYAPLTRGEAREIARRIARASSLKLSDERGIGFTLDDGALEYVVHQGGFDARFGARPMRQVFARIVESPIASRILEGRIHAGEHILVSTRENGGLTFYAGPSDDRTSLSQRPMRL